MFNEAELKFGGDVAKARFGLRLKVGKSLANTLAILVRASPSAANEPLPNSLVPTPNQNFEMESVPMNPLNIADLIEQSENTGVYIPSHLCPGTIVSVPFPALGIDVTALVLSLTCTQKFAYTLQILEPHAYATVFEAVVDHNKNLMWIKQATQQVVLCLAGASKYNIVSKAQSPRKSKSRRSSKSSKRPPKHSPKSRCPMCTALRKAKRIQAKTRKVTTQSQHGDEEAKVGSPHRRLSLHHDNVQDTPSIDVYSSPSSSPVNSVDSYYSLEDDSGREDIEIRAAVADAERLAQRNQIKGIKGARVAEKRVAEDAVHVAATAEEVDESKIGSANRKPKKNAVSQTPVTLPSNDSGAERDRESHCSSNDHSIYDESSHQIPESQRMVNNDENALMQARAAKAQEKLKLFRTEEERSAHKGHSHTAKMQARRKEAAELATEQLAKNAEDAKSKLHLFRTAEERQNRTGHSVTAATLARRKAKSVVASESQSGDPVQRGVQLFMSLASSERTLKLVSLCTGRSLLKRLPGNPCCVC
mgnify:CR=1 FL=1